MGQGTEEAATSPNDAEPEQFANSMAECLQWLEGRAA